MSQKWSQAMWEKLSKVCVWETKNRGESVKKNWNFVFVTIMILKGYF